MKRADFRRREVYLMNLSLLIYRVTGETEEISAVAHAHDAQVTGGSNELSGPQWGCLLG